MTEQGTVKAWFADRGFGFIKPDADGPDVFLHIDDMIESGAAEPMRGDCVRYEIGIGKNGRPRAIKIKKVG